MIKTYRRPRKGHRYRCDAPKCHASMRLQEEDRLKTFRIMRDRGWQVRTATVEGTIDYCPRHKPLATMPRGA